MIKVTIDSIDDATGKIGGEGYIIRRLNTNLYEIWSESHQTVFLLNKQEFTEIQDVKGCDGGDCGEGNCCV